MTHSKRIDTNKLFRALLIFSIAMFLLLQAATNVSSYVPEESREYKTVVVSSGDTLWSIASEYADGDIRDKIKDIKKFNNLKSDVLELGSHVKVPLYD